MLPLILEILKSILKSKKNLHLVILQNNNEIRATGGFITQLLVLETSFFKCRISFKNIYTSLTTNISRECPDAMKKMLFDHHTTTLQFRDANYNPDFAETALLLADIYKDSSPESNISSLTAVNSSFVEALLCLLRGVRVEGKIVNEKNFFVFLSGDVSDIDRHSKEALEGRKGVLKKLCTGLCKKILTHFYLLPAIFRKVRYAERSKDLQYYIYSSGVSSTTFGLPEHTDALSVIEDNYLGLKSNRYIQRTIFHDTHIDSEKVFHNKLNIEWRHHGIDNYPLTGHYRGRVRIYLPKNILLETCTEVDEVEITKSEDATIIGFSLFLDPLETFNFEVNYTLSNTQPENYTFQFIKQSGITGEILIKSLACAQSHEISQAQGPVKIKDSLYFTEMRKVSTDLSWSFQVLPGKNKPRITSHEIMKPDTALIEFNEEISIADLKVKISSKETHEVIPVLESFLDSSKKILVLKVPFKNEEEKFYTIQIEGIKNTNGIFIEPNPREVTVVYRSRYFR